MTKLGEEIKKILTRGGAGDEENYDDEWIIRTLEAFFDFHIMDKMTSKDNLVYCYYTYKLTI